MSNEHLIIIILATFNIFSLLIGFFLGRYNGVSYSGESRPQSFFQKEKVQSQKIEIDSKKIVTNIDTSGLEKKYETIADKKEVSDDISSSINKLKNIKR